jgi:hypothetical protein
MFHEAKEEVDTQPTRFKHGERLVSWFPLAPLISKFDGNQGLLPDSHDMLLAGVSVTTETERKSNFLCQGRTAVITSSPFNMSSFPSQTAELKEKRRDAE